MTDLSRHMWLRIFLTSNVSIANWTGNTVACGIFIVCSWSTPTATTPHTLTSIPTPSPTTPIPFWDCSHTVTWQTSTVSTFSLLIPSTFITFSSSFTIVSIRFIISFSQNTLPPSTCIVICATFSYPTTRSAYILPIISSSSLHVSSSQIGITFSSTITIIWRASFSSITLISIFSLTLINF